MGSQIKLGIGTQGVIQSGLSLGRCLGLEKLRVSTVVLDQGTLRVVMGILRILMKLNMFMWQEWMGNG